MNAGRVSIVVPLVAAVVGLAGGLLGAYLGARATIVTQREQAREDRSAEARSKRSRVYSRFVAAADSYRTETWRLFDSIERLATGAPSRNRLTDCLIGYNEQCRALDRVARRSGRVQQLRACYPRLELLCRPARLGGRWDKRRFAYVVALNDLYVYGTNRGVRAARRVADALPTGRWESDSHLVAPDENAYRKAYRAVLDTMCAEVSADPRPAC